MLLHNNYTLLITNISNLTTRLVIKLYDIAILHETV